MSSAYYQLLQLCDEPANKYATITVTVGLFGAHLDVYRNKVKMEAIPYSRDDERRLQTHLLNLTEISAPYIPAEKFLRVLKSAA